MTRQEIREQYSFDLQTSCVGGDPVREAGEKITCALMCVAYAIADLAEAVWDLQKDRK